MSTAEAPRKRILLVDDFRDFVLATRIFLESEGYEVIEAYDGIQALEILDKVATEGHGRPDLIILDVMMPRLDGWQCLAQIQADDRLRDIPVMMLTALKEPAYIKTGIDLGSTWYYTKPITNYPDFALVINRIISTVTEPCQPSEDA